MKSVNTAPARNFGTGPLKKNKTPRKAAFFLTVTVAAVLLAAALISFTLRNRMRITSENREYLTDNASQVAASIDAALSDGFDNIRILSELVSKSLTGPEFNIASMQELIKNSVFDFMEFADKDGMDHNITGGVSDARDRQYYLDAKAGNTGMELIYVSRATHETLLMFYSPIYYENEFVGSLVGVYQAANRITKLLSSSYFGEPATAYLATDTGRIIACNSGFDPQNELLVTDLAENNAALEAQLKKALVSDETVTFSVTENTTGGCMLRLPVSGWHLIQIFPQEASNRMIRSANRLGYLLVGFLLLLYAGILFSLIIFYRRQQKQVEEARNQAEIANRAKTSFLFNMSHDIRTPMNAIIGFTNMGLKYIDDREKVRDCLNKTQQSGTLLLSLINSVLDMSRIEAGSAGLDEIPFDVFTSFSGIEPTMRELAGIKHIDMSFFFGVITDRYVYVDMNRFIRIFTNLVTNAIKYTNDGGSIRVSCEQEGSVKNGYATFRYTVEDNGIGMSGEFQEHMFEAFSREQNSTTSGIQGTGLGLSVCKTFVEYLNGTITCSSRQGVGTVFTVMLPFRVRKIEDEMPVENISGNTDKKAVVFCGRRILLVEDNELNREIARDLLEEQGLIVDEAEDGSIAVEQIKEKGPDYYDLILMDIQMPVMNGYEATGAIRRLYPDKNIPIIALSANAFAEDKEASRSAGMNDHIAKPIDPAALFAVMEKYL